MRQGKIEADRLEISEDELWEDSFHKFCEKLSEKDASDLFELKSFARRKRLTSSPLEAYEKCMNLIYRCRSLKIKIIEKSSKIYPAPLRLIRDAPDILFCKGNIGTYPKVGCVGTRSPTHWGTEVSKRISSLIAVNGCTVVSGLAVGVDTICHSAALDVKGHTIAVVANGLDSVYPLSNARLLNRILENGGAVVTTVPPGEGVSKDNLVKRNRIISGMSSALIVMQTGMSGGTLHTVGYAIGQKRIIFVPDPGPVFSEEKSLGNLALISDLSVDFDKLKAGNSTISKIKNTDLPIARKISGKNDYFELIKEIRAISLAHEENNGIPSH